MKVVFVNNPKEDEGLFLSNLFPPIDNMSNFHPYFLEELSRINTWVAPWLATKVVQKLWKAKVKLL